jgi:hypothetical protein
VGINYSRVDELFLRFFVGVSLVWCVTVVSLAVRIGI